MKRIDFKGIMEYFNPRGEEGADIKALRDWKALFFCSALLFASLLAVDFCFFLAHEKASKELPNAAVEKRELNINRRDLNDVLKELDEKKRNFENILSAPEMKDPSL